MEPEWDLGFLSWFFLKNSFDDFLYYYFLGPQIICLNIVVLKLLKLFFPK